jgi:hypothetical protein
MMAFDYVGSLQPYLAGAQGSPFSYPRTMFGAGGAIMGPSAMNPPQANAFIPPQPSGNPQSYGGGGINQNFVGDTSQPPPSDQSSFIGRGGTGQGAAPTQPTQPPDATTPSSASPSGPGMPQPAGSLGERNVTGTQASNVPPNQGPTLPVPPPTRPTPQQPLAPTQLPFQDLNSILPYLPQLMRQWSGDLYGGQGAYGAPQSAFPVLS